jgi:hypothetical protein
MSEMGPIDFCLFAGKRRSADTDVKHDITAWLKTLDTTSMLRYTPCCHGAINASVWMMTVWRSGVWHLLPMCHLYLLTYLLTPWSRVLLKKPTVSQLVKKNPPPPRFDGTRRFITTYTSNHHLSLFWGRSIRSILPIELQGQFLYTALLYPIYSICPTHLILLDLMTWIIFGEYRSLSSSLCIFLHYPVTSSLLGPNILLRILYSKTLSLCSSLSVSDQVSHPYKTIGKIIVLYILIFIFLDSKLEDKIQ